LYEPGAAANGAGTLLSGKRRLHCDGAEVNHHLGCSAVADWSGPLEPDKSAAVN
jgi:alcohol dehydrogenase